MNIQSYNKTLLARPSQPLENHLREVKEIGLSYMPKDILNNFEEKSIFETALFFHDVGKSLIPIQEAYHAQEDPPISHTYLSLIFFYSYFLEKYQIDIPKLLKNKKIRTVAFSILSHHSPPHQNLDFNIFSQFSNKRVLIASEIFEILQRNNFNLSKEKLKETFDVIVDGYKNNTLEFWFKTVLDQSVRKEFVIFYNALVKADWESASGERDLKKLDMSSIKKSIVNSEKSEIHKKFYHREQFSENVLLELPTGYGKTYLGVEYGLKTRRKRLIYTLPVTTIIEDVYGRLSEIFSQDSIEWYTSKYLIFKTLSGKLDEREYIKARYFEKPIIITTLDQILLALLSVDRYPLKEASLYDSCIILDEPQLYSPFMLLLFAEFIKDYHNIFNFMIMSATIPNFIKERLRENAVEPYGSKLAEIYKNYNRTRFDTTFIGKNLFCESGVTPEISELIHQYISEGKKIFIIFNTVNKAQKFYEILKVEAPKFLFHARYIFRDRYTKLKEIKALAKCCAPLVIISTQVIEAGVDISCDVMFRELAPFDSLIQSAGRVNRNKENPAPCPVYVFGTPDDYLPYKKYQLEITCNKILKLPQLSSTKTEFDFYEALQKYWELMKNYIIEDEEKAKKTKEAVDKISPFSINIDEEKIDLRESYPKVCVVPEKFLGEVINLYKAYKNIPYNKYMDRKEILALLESYLVEVPLWGKVSESSVFKDYIFLIKECDNRFYGISLDYDSLKGLLDKETNKFL